ncbi:hypothetical protein [Urbifossiella limnaea]|uniref:Uncharacterized protein n=1 Tax=Urbifossiella limnaea TaxID=2528023 RepID=A0A517XSS7_9BACT|nr:hypothetical protein [Urbifossiella limnaea]QDU20559.1 hypothetical protein ETAA1_25140 [Urbifossiella limnaea]
MATAPAPTVWSVVRDILSSNINLSADEVITKAKAKGLKAPDAVIRGTVYTVRKKLKQKVPAAKPVLAAARTTAPAKPASPSVSSVVRAILSADLDLSADEVVAKAKAQGLTASDTSIRASVYNIRGELKRKPGQTPKAAVAPSKPASAPVAAPVAQAPAPVAVTTVLSNVALVNGAVAASGGVEQARKVAEAVRACGGPEAFAQYLDLVAGIRTA